MAKELIEVHPIESLEVLPVEILVLLASYLTIQDCVELSRLNHFFYNIIHDNISWKRRLQVQYPVSYSILEEKELLEETDYFIECCHAYIISYLSADIQMLFYAIRYNEIGFIDRTLIKISDLVSDIDIPYKLEVWLNAKDLAKRNFVDFAFFHNKDLGLHIIKTIWDSLTSLPFEDKYSLCDKLITLSAKYDHLTSYFANQERLKILLNPQALFYRSIQENGEVAACLVRYYNEENFILPHYFSHAIKAQQQSVIEALLNKGFSPKETNITDSKGNRRRLIKYSIDCYSGEKQYAVISLLIKHEIKISLKETGQHLLQYALQNAKPEAALALLESGQFDIYETINVEGEEIGYLRFAIERGYFSIFKYLLAAGMDPRALVKYNLQGQAYTLNLLHLSAMNNNPLFIKYLVDEQGFDINEPYWSCDMKLPLGAVAHLAIMSGNYSSLQAILSCEPDLSVLDGNKLDLITLAAVNCSNEKILALLLEQVPTDDSIVLALLENPNVNPKNYLTLFASIKTIPIDSRLFHSTLNYAILNKDEKYIMSFINKIEESVGHDKKQLSLILVFLLQDYCKLTQPDNDFDKGTLIHKTIDLFISKIINSDLISVADMLLYAAKLGHTDLAELMINHGIVLESVYADGKTALQVAIENKQVDFFHFLVNKGANINHIDFNNRTLLHSALDLNDSLSFGIIKCLVEKKITTINHISEGYSPLHLAIINNAGISICKMLITAGANIALPIGNTYKMHHKGKTPLILAIETNRISLVKLLVNETNVNKSILTSTGIIFPLQQALLFLIERDKPFNVHEKEGYIIDERYSNQVSTLDTCDMIKVLIAKGANLMLKVDYSKDGITQSLPLIQWINRQLLDNNIPYLHPIFSIIKPIQCILLLKEKLAEFEIKPKGFGFFIRKELESLDNKCKVITALIKLFQAYKIKDEGKLESVLKRSSAHFISLLEQPPFDELMLKIKAILSNSGLLYTSSEAIRPR